MPTEVQSVNHLEDRMYRRPGQVHQVMTRQEYRETLVATENFIMACGHGWKLKAKSIGAGMYEVKLVPFE